MSLIEVKNITKRFDDKLILDNISFNIEEGDIFGLIGPNGAGKSTMINIMTGLLESDTGSINIGGYDLKTNPIKVKEQIGLVPQELAIMEEVSAYDNLEFFGSLYGLKGKELKESIDDVLDITGLLDKKKEKVKKFSGGMKRRLNIACGIIHKPKILIMDEPMVGVDPQSRNHIFEFTRKINREDKTTIIYTSHYMQEVEVLCNNLYIIDLGKEIAYGSKKSIKSMIGTNTKIVLKLSEYNKEVLRDIKSLSGVKELIEESYNIKLIIDEENFKLEDLVKATENLDIKIKGINFEEPTLEEVFLALTGKRLRD
ncbi:ABC transporter ATP-binding protein [Gottschalkia acidurici 9a]|uniref:ABC transporter ATP-binding protein n=1 Tax=Gottschalkia acidurici (strain ATCC 7906 / DSM 604 / BCRC 14475 / CIP 104303 / KCTC 5404 / NCIMB 10678 / 9a) TaxID=1128398 RepID=K0B294_GOTA9|nr:ABC transporter ATP-binding protein [Gottschalkia acidurici]AFS79614.1 ABC transporter ATP-binding protein [Gottschalkia acidurici 9a]